MKSSDGCHLLGMSNALQDSISDVYSLVLLAVGILLSVCGQYSVLLSPKFCRHYENLFTYMVQHSHASCMALNLVCLSEIDKEVGIHQEKWQTEFHIDGMTVHAISFSWNLSFSSDGE